ncbi:MAG: HlyC/CorC family transporter [Planctomycetes bacterium]|nr:HlyC/CorC family transporter [Planctomycetota bacterium]
MLPLLIAMLLLLCSSALFSAAETAIFSLADKDVDRLPSAGSRALIRRLVARRTGVLISLLLGNLIANFGFFALGNVLAEQLRSDMLPLWADAVAPAAVALVILCGEVTPKLVAVRNPAPIAALVAFPVTCVDVALLPIRSVLAFVSTALLRFITGPRRAEGRLATVELDELLRLSAQAGHIAADEREQLQTVLLLSRVTVREIMVPRVQLIAFDLRLERREFFALAASCQHNKIPVHRGDLDGIDGWLDAKEVGAHPEAALDSLVHPLGIVPEGARVAALLPLLIDERRRMLLVVDEYGGTAGLVTHADLEHAVLGDMQDEGDSDRALITHIGVGEWSVDGVLGLNFLHVLTGRRGEEGQQAASVGGVVMALLDRIPLSGDRVRYVGLDLEVTEMRRFRPVRVHVRLLSEGAS